MTAGVATRLTAAGAGGLQVVALRGVATSRFIDRRFHHGRRRLEAGRAYYGRLQDDDEWVDEVVLVLHCMTGDDAHEAELVLHGGALIERRLRELLEADGFRWVDAADFAPTYPALPLAPAIEREANDALAGARSVQGLLFMLSVLEGALAREVAGLATGLRGGGARRAIEERLDALTARYEFGHAHLEPPRVVLVGPVNVGKSTLFNRLVGEARVMTSDRPGTTRDSIEAEVEIFGYPFLLTDTAGERAATDAIEVAGIERARRVRRQADIVVEVRDLGDTVHPASVVSVEMSPANGSSDASTKPRAGTNAPTLVALNKRDRIDAVDVLAREESVTRAVAVSATTGEGLDRLLRFVVHASVFACPSFREQPVPFTDRQVDGLRRARCRLAASDLVGAAEALDEVRFGRDVESADVRVNEPDDEVPARPQAPKQRERIEKRTTESDEKADRRGAR